MAKILVVDDEHDVCDFVKTFFEERSYDVMAAYDGEEALRIAKSQKPDIILLDIRMKKMDGIETLKKLRDFDKNVNVIMVTAVADRDKIDIASKFGAKGYITKPLVLEELESAVYENTKKKTQ